MIIDFRVPIFFLFYLIFKIKTTHKVNHTEFGEPLKIAIHPLNQTGSYYRLETNWQVRRQGLTSLLLKRITMSMRVCSRTFFHIYCVVD